MDLFSPDLIYIIVDSFYVHYYMQHIKDKFCNFVFYKFIFIFGVMNVQNMDEVLMWCAWFLMLGFLHILAQLCKDRCEYVSIFMTDPRSQQWGGPIVFSDPFLVPVLRFPDDDTKNKCFTVDFSFWKMNECY